MAFVNMDQVILLANENPKLQKDFRFSNLAVKLAVGEEERFLNIENGVVSYADGSTYDVCFSADQEMWEKMLQPVPVPFYHTFSSARTMHGFQVEDSADFQYLKYSRGFEELLRVIRQASNGGEK